jgi:hypothetical protein
MEILNIYIYINTPRLSCYQISSVVRPLVQDTKDAGSKSLRYIVFQYQNLTLVLLFILLKLVIVNFYII